MQEKLEAKLSTHQIILRNGFYRLPLRSLLEILQLLEMPQTKQPRLIQQYAVVGFLRMIQKHQQKYRQHVQHNKFIQISQQSKNIVEGICRQICLVMNGYHTMYMDMSYGNNQHLNYYRIPSGIPIGIGYGMQQPQGQNLRIMNLQHYDGMGNMGQIANMAGIAHMPGMANLTPISMAQLPTMANMAQLKNMNINNMSQMNNMNQMNNMTNMTNMSQMPGMINMSQLPNMANMAQMQNMTNMANLAQMPNMAMANMINMPKMGHMTNMANITTVPEMVMNANSHKPVSQNTQNNQNNQNTQNTPVLPTTTTFHRQAKQPQNDSYRQLVEQQIKLQQAFMYYNSCYGRTMPQIYQTPMMNYSEEAKKQPEQNTKTSIVPEPEKTETPAQSVSTPAITTNTNTKTVTNISITTKQPSSSTNGSTNNIRKPQTPTSVPPATLLTKPTLKPLTSNGDLNEIYIHLNLKDTISKTKIQKQLQLPLQQILRRKNRGDKEKQQQQQQRKKKTPIFEFDPSLKHCACKGQFNYVEKFMCCLCGKYFHFYCLSESISKMQTGQPIQCFGCRMRQLDPLNKVQYVIGEFYITNIQESRFTVKANFKPYEQKCRQRGRSEIQLRCLKVCNGIQNLQITWPDQCVIKLNGQKIVQTTALSAASSLKKRKDYAIFITQNIFNKGNWGPPTPSLQEMRLSLEIKALTEQQKIVKKIKNNFTFVFGIYLVQKLTIDELFTKIVNQQHLKMPQNYFQDLMLTVQHQVQIDKIIVNLNDPYTWQLIQVPVRGDKCLHGQCYDLKTFISFMNCAKSRTWRCPICCKDARKFMIDHKQGEILKKIKESHKVPSEISFQKNGDILLKIDDNGKDDEEPRLAARTEKTKVICKEQKSVGNVVKTEHNRNEEDKSDKLAGKSATTTGEAVSVVSAGASATVTDQGLTSKHTS